jgi:TPR repeat protein
LARLGEFFFRGEVTNKDLKKSYEYFSKSNEEAVSQYYLGVMFANGYHVKKDPIEGMKWFTKSAEKNYALGQTNLAYGFLNGIGVKQSNEEAIKYFRLAAKNKNSFSQFNLGAMYYDGIGLKKDHIKGLMWVYLASKENESDYKLVFKRLSSDVSKSDVELSIKMAEDCINKKFENCE